MSQDMKNLMANLRKHGVLFYEDDSAQKNKDGEDGKRAEKKSASVDRSRP